jgi:hypothetical protein
MKRSEIDRQIEKFIDFAKENNYEIPIYDYQNKKIIKELLERQIGFDITDFGSGDFNKIGLALFTVRNGNPREKKTIPYCEKTMFSLPGQLTPRHYHKKKIEDIFLRAGSPLVIRIWQTDQPRDKKIEFSVLFNGADYREVIAGQELFLNIGESVTLTPDLSHEFFSDPTGVGSLIGEVSTFNDDLGDNIFIDPVARFPKIQEDQPIKYYLVSDYKKLNIASK